MPGLDLDDCTHFISCCIGTPPPKGMRAGGLRIPDVQGLGTPNLVPYGIISAPVLVKFLTEAGDIVVYKSRENSGASHMALHLGGGTVACHTSCRMGARWNEIPFGFHEFLHILV